MKSFYYLLFFFLLFSIYSCNTHKRNSNAINSDSTKNEKANNTASYDERLERCKQYLIGKWVFVVDGKDIIDDSIDIIRITNDSIFNYIGNSEHYIISNIINCNKERNNDTDKVFFHCEESGFCWEIFYVDSDSLSFSVTGGAHPSEVRMHRYKGK